ncbi:MAG: hypothetical protein II680_10180, partial [Clostridia bacterium]|nr:hypothetical protein [Clostridia bacterium]
EDAELNEGSALFHVKQYTKPIVFLDPREDRRSDPESRKRDNAECAPESLPEAAGFILRMFQLHARRSSPVGSILRLVRLNLSKPAGIGPCSD